MLEVELRRDGEAAVRLTRGDIVRLTQEATRATFYTSGLTAEQVEANERIPQMSGQAVLDAAASHHQHLAAAFAAGRLAGFMIATRHAPDDLELDWLMVHPHWHGTGLAASLLGEGIGWLGERRPIWLTVIRHNRRAIRFYEKYGFEVDPLAALERPVPSWIMRRRPAPLQPVASIDGEAVGAPARSRSRSGSHVQAGDLRL